MARNWANTRRRTRALRLADALLAPLSLAVKLRRRRPLPDAPRILVFEFWYLGDAVMAEPFLRALRGRFPRAQISLLCTPATRALLQPNGIVDRFIEIDVPWRAFARKYDWRRYTAPAFGNVVRALRRERFDVVVDSRMDLRSNILSWLIGADRRIGFDVPGGRGLLTDRVPDSGEHAHKVSDWLAMLEPLGGGATGSTPPRLDVDDATQRRVDARLLELGVTPGTTLVAMHPSARQEVRRWPLDRFAEVARAVGEMADTRVLVLVDPDGYGQSLEETGAICVRATIPELGAYLRRCSVFVGNDTGPAHIAAAVGTMTVTIFGPGSMEWFRPFGPDQRLVFLDPMPCRPCFDRCTQPTNICLQDLSTGRVILAVREALSDHIESRGQLAGAR